MKELSAYWWVADRIETWPDGRMKFYKNGVEIAYPWELIDPGAPPDDDKSAGEEDPQTAG